jgi:hypothetical protein
MAFGDKDFWTLYRSHINYTDEEIENLKPYLRSRHFVANGGALDYNHLRPT